MKFLISLSRISLLFLLISPLSADYLGPAYSNTVAEVLLNPKDDSYVMLTGYITQKLEDELYSFKDETGTLLIEIEEDDFPSEGIDAETLVKIEGEVDSNGSGLLLVQVDEVRLMDAVDS